MKTYIIILFLLFTSNTLVFSNNSGFEEPHTPIHTTLDEENCVPTTQSYQPGEHLEYKVYYNWKFTWLTAGTVTFEVLNNFWNGMEVWHTRAIGKTLRAYEWFYKVYDQYESYLDPFTNKPVRFIRNVNEGGYTMNNHYTFDHDQQEVYLDYLKTQGETKRQNETLPINACTHDMLSAIYQTRNIDYSQYVAGDIISIEVFMDGRIQEIHIQYSGIETIKTKLGKFEALKLHPTLHESYLFEGGKKMTIWATNDANKIPLLIEAPLKVGFVKAILNNYDQLAYDLTSKQ